jgi:hypothetical protein
MRLERIFTAEGAAKQSKQDVLGHPSLSAILLSHDL